MEQKIKEIVATFIRVPAEQIGPGTPIDRSAVNSSILLHRMYARLAEEGLVVENYAAVKVFSDLSQPAANRERGQDNQGAETSFSAISYTGATTPASVGIDIEEIAALPRTTDFRKEEFYRMNFTPAEIAYCILQPDPYSSFAGLFAVKEAIVKADESKRNSNFNTLEIQHSPEGKPLYPHYGVSISHAGGMAVAVVARVHGMSEATASPAVPVLQTGPFVRQKTSSSWIAWLALLISVLALLIVLLH